MNGIFYDQYYPIIYPILYDRFVIVYLMLLDNIIILSVCCRFGGVRPATILQWCQCRQRPWVTCCRRVGIKTPSVLMEINVVVCEPLSAVTQHGLSNKHFAERVYGAHNTLATALFCGILELPTLMIRENDLSF